MLINNNAEQLYFDVNVRNCYLIQHLCFIFIFNLICLDVKV